MAIALNACHVFSALVPFANCAKSLDPSASNLLDEFAPKDQIDYKCKLVINQKLAMNY